MKNMIAKIIIGSPFEPLARFLLNKPKIPFDNSESYWEHRYKVGGNSGVGSYGRLAQFKAQIINEFVSKNDVDTVIEFGCGDGNQLSLANYPSYIGVDVSQKAINVCKEKFSNDEAKQFFTTTEYGNLTAELTLSLDVLYHLVEDDIYHNYMLSLFKSAERFVIVYASNYSEDIFNAEHVKHRKFTDWVKGNAPSFSLLAHIPNKYPYDENGGDNTSLADFYIFEKTV